MKKEKIIPLLILSVCVLSIIFFGIVINRVRNENLLINNLKNGYIPTEISSLENGYYKAQSVSIKWNPASYLSEVASSYSIENNQFKFLRGIYTFLSPNKETYLVISIDSNGEINFIGPGPNEGQASHPTAPYDFKKNKISSIEIVNQAWTKFGSKLICKDKITSINVSGDGYASQSWIVVFGAKDFQAGTAYINFDGSERIKPDINTNFCK